MSPEQLSQLTDQELLDLARKAKSSAIVHATLIGVMVGIVIYGVAKGNFGFFFLLLLFVLYKIFREPQSNEALEKQLKARNLK